MTDDFPDDENGWILRSIQARGTDLSVTRQVDFSLVFEDSVGAAKFLAMASNLGFACQMVELDEDERPGWDVTASILMSPNHQNITDAERQLAELGHPYGGEPDGWGFLVEPPAVGV